ncbi:MAG: CZB domain-containing protein [Rhizobium sp.]
MEAAKVEHLAYKYEAVEALVSGSNSLSVAATDDAACQLGHWLRTGNGKVCFSRLGAFRQLERAHGEFHRRTAAMLLADAPSASALQGVTAIDVAERTLMRALDQLMVEAEQNADVFCSA